jgi:hypothetical protein
MPRGGGLFHVLTCLKSLLEYDNTAVVEVPVRSWAGFE